MLINILLISVLVILYFIIFSIAWNQAPDEENLTEEEREAALMMFYHP